MKGFSPSLSRAGPSTSDTPSGHDQRLPNTKDCEVTTGAPTLVQLPPFPKRVNTCRCDSCRTMAEASESSINQTIAGTWDRPKHVSIEAALKTNGKEVMGAGDRNAVDHRTQSKDHRELPQPGPQSSWVPILPLRPTETLRDATVMPRDVEIGEASVPNTPTSSEIEERNDDVTGSNDHEFAAGQDAVHRGMRGANRPESTPIASSTTLNRFGNMRAMKHGNPVGVEDSSSDPARYSDAHIHPAQRPSGTQEVSAASEVSMSPIDQDGPPIEETSPPSKHRGKLLPPRLRPACLQDATRRLEEVNISMRAWVASQAYTKFSLSELPTSDLIKILADLESCNSQPPKTLYTQVREVTDHAGILPEESNQVSDLHGKDQDTSGQKSAATLPDCVEKELSRCQHEACLRIDTLENIEMFVRSRVGELEIADLEKKSDIKVIRKELEDVQKKDAARQRRSRKRAYRRGKAAAMKEASPTNASPASALRDQIPLPDVKEALVIKVRPKVPVTVSFKDSGAQADLSPSSGSTGSSYDTKTMLSSGAPNLQSRRLMRSSSRHLGSSLETSSNLNRNSDMDRGAGQRFGRDIGDLEGLKGYVDDDTSLIFAGLPPHGRGVPHCPDPPTLTPNGTFDRYLKISAHRKGKMPIRHKPKKKWEKPQVTPYPKHQSQTQIISDSLDDILERVAKLQETFTGPQDRAIEACVKDKIMELFRAWGIQRPSGAENSPVATRSTSQTSHGAEEASPFIPDKYMDPTLSFYEWSPLFPTFESVEDFV